MCTELLNLSNKTGYVCSGERVKQFVAQKNWEIEKETRLFSRIKLENKGTEKN